MKRVILLIVILGLFNSTFAQNEKYSRIKINNIKPVDLGQLAGKGMPVDDGFYDFNSESYTIELSQREVGILKTMNLKTEVLVEDVSEWYVARNSGSDLNKIMEEARRAPSDYPVPADFELGSCGGFYTIDQCYAELDYMAATYPDLITVRAPVSDLLTFENRSMYYVKISDNPNQAEGEPQVLYTGMHHAREGIGMQHLIFYMYYLLENYNTNPDIQNLVNNTEMFFIPILNVDGYARNIQTNPSGGGMWRKNRFNNGDGSFGIDVNRNYGFFWGYDNEGSSPYTWDETYRGTGPFSEAENQMIKEFCESHEFKIALNYHSYSNLLLYAWGYTPEVSPDEAVFALYSKYMTTDNHYTYGPGSTTIYPSNGGSDDWMYGEQDTKGKILAYTPECGSQNDGFWPSTSRIIPLCQENMIQSIYAARFAGTYGSIFDQTPLIIPDKEYFAIFDVTRLGQTPTNYRVHIEPLGDQFLSAGDTIEINGLEVLQKITDSIPFTLSDRVESGDTIRFVLELYDGYATYRDTLEKYFGTPVNLFTDDLTNIDNWTGNWALSNIFPWSAPSSMADSPSGNYSNNSNKSTQLAMPVTLTNASVAVLNFYTKWNIESGYDYVQVSISNNNGQSWTPLQGRYTTLGTENQAYQQPLYDGRSGWVREEINISSYADDDIKLRFTLRSDNGLTFDGYYFDDVSIDVIDRTVSVKDNPIASFYISEGYPNPSNDLVKFKYSIEKMSSGKVILTDLYGKQLKEVALNSNEGEITLSTDGFIQGVYLCHFYANGMRISTRKITLIN